MAFLRYARASVTHPQISGSVWQQIRTAAQSEVKVSENLVDRAGGIFGKLFKPSDYLLTHCSIVASVDVYAPTGMKVGTVVEDGFRVNRQYPKFRVKANCDSFINNNNDLWPREVLLKSYRTFIGAHSFVEHVQREELSRGRIIDAVARDIGDSVYVDILVANDRRHTDLIEAIKNGKMSTLSMGCSITGSQCTKCGHWAADETETCAHVKYEKGNVFFDEQGQRHRIAEKCGDESIDPNGGVQFIEASWVAIPAFAGAVLRNVLDVTPEIAKKAQAVLASPPPEWSSDAQIKAAALQDTFMAGWDENSPDEGVPPAATAPPADPLKGVEDQLHKYLIDRVLKRVQKDLDQQELANVPQTTREPSTVEENVIKEAQATKYNTVLNFVCRTASSDAELVDRVARLNQEYGVVVPVSVYRAALKAASVATDTKVYLRECSTALGRVPSNVEARVLLRLGKIISQRGQARGETTKVLADASFKKE